jgi:hypothetical protein
MLGSPGGFSGGTLWRSTHSLGGKQRMKRMLDPDTRALLEDQRDRLDRILAQADWVNTNGTVRALVAEIKRAIDKIESTLQGYDPNV